jgi:hypothetical protein
LALALPVFFFAPSAPSPSEGRVRFFVIGGVGALEEEEGGELEDDEEEAAEAEEEESGGGRGETTRFSPTEATAGVGLCVLIGGGGRGLLTPVFFTAAAAGGIGSGALGAADALRVALDAFTTGGGGSSGNGGEPDDDEFVSLAELASGRAFPLV